VDPDDATPTYSEADRLRAVLRGIVASWTDEQWFTWVPRVTRFSSRQSYIDTVLSVNSADLDRAVLYAWFREGTHLRPRIYILGQHYESDAVKSEEVTPVNEEEEEEEEVTELPHPDGPPSPLHTSIDVVPLIPILELAPRCAIVILHHEQCTQGHFECVGYRESTGVRTMFPLDHPFIQRLDAWQKQEPGTSLAVELQWREEQPYEDNGDVVVHTDVVTTEPHSPTVNPPPQSLPRKKKLVVSRPTAPTRPQPRPLKRALPPSPSRLTDSVPWRTKRRALVSRLVSVADLSPERHPRLVEYLARASSATANKCVSCLVNSWSCSCPRRTHATKEQLDRAEATLTERNRRHFRTRVVYEQQQQEGDAD
jgi:hypothetical protein